MSVETIDWLVPVAAFAIIVAIVLSLSACAPTTRTSSIRPSTVPGWAYVTECNGAGCEEWYLKVGGEVR